MPDGRAEIVSTRERIRAVAVSLFAAKGFHASGIREIAVASGLSPSTLYNYMGGKEELLAEIMIANIESVSAAAEESLASVQGPAARLAALIRTHVLAQIEDPFEAMVSDNELRALGSDSRRRVVKQRDSYEDLWRGVLESGHRAGVFDLAQASITRAVLIEACNGVVRWYSPKGSLPKFAVADQLVELGLRILRATDDSGRQLELRDVAAPSSVEIAAIVARIFALRRSRSQL